MLAASESQFLRKIHAKPHYVYSGLYCIIITRQYSALTLLLLRDRPCFNLNGAFWVQTKETEIPNGAKEAKTVIANIHAPEQFKRATFSFLLLVRQQKKVSVSASQVQPKEAATAALEVRVVTGKGKYTNEFWRACNAIKDSVNLQHRC